MTDILQLYCDVDDFYRMILPLIEKSRLSDGKQLRNRESVMSMSEVMTILILFHQSGYRNLKTFYTQFIYDQLKNISQIEHTRHRSVINFFVNLFAGLIAYTYQEKKPSLNLREEHLVTFQGYW